MERGGGGRWGRQEQVRQGVSQDGDDRTETGWQREVAQHGLDAGSSLAGQSRPSHAWPSDVAAAGASLVPGCWDRDTSGATSPGLGSAPPRLPAPALLGLPCAVGHRVRPGAGGGGLIPSEDPPSRHWGVPHGHGVLQMDPVGRGLWPPRSAWLWGQRRSGASASFPSILQRGEPRGAATRTPQGQHGVQGAPGAQGSPPKSPQLPQRWGGEERQGKG